MSESLYQEIGRRIKRARENLKMSQEELAKQLQYNSPTTISYYESGERKISIFDLQRIATVLGLRTEDLLEDNASEEVSYLFRTKEVRPAARKTVGAFLAFAKKNGKPPFVVSSGRSESSPGRAAKALLENLGISEPPVSPRQVAQKAGILVFDWDFPDEISGIFVKSGVVVSIGVNEQHPSVRQRFTIAHELGHYILGDIDRETIHVDFVEIDNVPLEEERKKQETRANQFAADLLMPRNWLRRDYQNLDGDVTLLAKRYEVSEQALWFRLLALKLLDNGQ